MCRTDISVDGTSGFIRHQQFAVCLALIVDGQVELGVIGCPNLGPEPAKIGEEVMPNGKGVLMVAVKGEGSYSVSAYCLNLWEDITEEAATARLGQVHQVGPAPVAPRGKPIDLP